MSRSDRRNEEIEAVIEPIERQGWEHLDREERPEWVIKETPADIRLHTGERYDYDIIHGDEHVFKVASSVHGNDVHVFRKLKSEYFDTDSEEGTCPNCQSYIRRRPDDRYLTCPNCGWQYKPLSDQVKSPFRILSRLRSK